MIRKNKFIRDIKPDYIYNVVGRRAAGRGIKKKGVACSICISVVSKHTDTLFLRYFAVRNAVKVVENILTSTPSSPYNSIPLFVYLFLSSTSRDVPGTTTARTVKYKHFHSTIPYTFKRSSRKNNISSCRCATSEGCPHVKIIARRTLFAKGSPWKCFQRNRRRTRPFARELARPCVGRRFRPSLSH